jgi:hydroxymethylpyrimidine/phosphomethylpyrimidine kinase
MSIPIALSIAGSDSGGGAGVQADLKTFSALGVYGASVITALTAQNTKGVFAIHNVPADFITAEIDAVFSDLDVRAVKIGMLGNVTAIEAVATGLVRHNARNAVLDPIMVASTGADLLRADAIDALWAMIPRVRLVTPNLFEAATLLDAPLARNEDEMNAQGRALLALGASAVLLKGGHAGGPQSIDLLIEAGGCTRFVVPRINTRNTHGTGCTLASAIAAGLAKAHSLDEAVRDAKAYITSAIAGADRLKIGAGRGPVHHFPQWW